jgi:hypothetical protein
MTTERWQALSKNQQLLSIGAEIMRAAVWQKKDSEKFLRALAEGLALIDACLEDKKWRDSTRQLLGFREALAEFYVGKRNGDIKKLYEAL